MNNELKEFSISLHGRPGYYLDGFYPNGNGKTKDIVKFSRTSRIIFHTELDARKYIEYILNESANSAKRNWIPGLYDSVIKTINKLCVTAFYNIENDEI